MVNFHFGLGAKTGDDVNKDDQSSSQAQDTSQVQDNSQGGSDPVVVTEPVVQKKVQQDDIQGEQGEKSPVSEEKEVSPVVSAEPENVILDTPAAVETKASEPIIESAESVEDSKVPSPPEQTDTVSAIEETPSLEVPSFGDVVAKTPIASASTQDSVGEEKTVSVPEVNPFDLSANQESFSVPTPTEPVSIEEEKPVVQEVSDVPPVSIAPEFDDIVAPAEKETSPSFGSGSAQSAQTSDDSSGSHDPMLTLKQVKSDIENFVKGHKSKIKSYQNEIDGLKNKIRKEENELRNKQKQFSEMAKEIEGLTGSFNTQNGQNTKKNSKHQPQKNKQIRNTNNQEPKNESPKNL